MLVEGGLVGEATFLVIGDDHALESVGRDFLLEVADVDPDKIGVTGASGGGTQTFALMAVDDRIAAAAPICMISYHMQGGCLCENAPLLRLDATNVEIARLFAPRPLFLGSCTGDWTRNTPEVERPAIAETYRQLEAEDSVFGLHVDAQHNYNQELRQAVYGFFNKCFFGAATAAPVPEQEVPRPPLRDRMVWWGREAPAPMDFDDFRALWRVRAESALEPFADDAGAVRSGLGTLLAHVLGIGLTGPKALPPAKAGIRIVQAGQDLIVDPVGDPETPSSATSFFSTYNPTFCATRVQQILCALEAVDGTVRLVGNGTAGLWCLLAGALSRKVTALDVDLNGFEPEDDAAWQRHLDLPGIRQIGGLKTLFAMLGDRPCELRNATEPTCRHNAGSDSSKRYI